MRWCSAGSFHGHASLARELTSCWLLRIHSHPGWRSWRAGRRFAPVVVADFFNVLAEACKVGMECQPLQCEQQCNVGNLYSRIFCSPSAFATLLTWLENSFLSRERLSDGGRTYAT
mmetsp:Transcript_46928/g.84821  ORF Transcript_46928/g.84821 Transcript_46928/m.84821 type:complete len:116 (+) Transcript_46928:3856-4203(+)